MTQRSQDGGADAAHDVLAAEEFPPPAGPDADTPDARAHAGREFPTDPAGDRPHDVLVAEEFAIPAVADADTPAARAHRGLPRDPQGERPHDVLAAEEFAVPAGADVAGSPRRAPRRGRVGALALAGAGGLLALIRVRRARR
jgi:hypothetical protein